MRLCKQCANTVWLTTFRCERCNRALPGISRRMLRRNLMGGGLALAIVTALAAFAVL
jgi:hypothetical protein